MTASSQTPEYLYSEKPTLDQLQQMNWQYIEEDIDNPAITERETFKQVLLKDRLRKALLKFTPWLDENQIETAITTLERSASGHSLIETNQAIFDLLITGINSKTPEGREEMIPYIDFNNPQNNDFLAINQFRVDPPWATSKKGHIRPDITLFVNGIPLIVIECKSPKLDNPLTEAIADLLKYSNQRGSQQPEGVQRLFAYNLFMVAASQHRAAAGTVGASYEHYVEWKDTTPFNPSDIAQSLGVSELNSRQMLIAGMLHPENLLDIFHNFTLFKTSGGRTIKIIPRYPQYKAVHQALYRLQHNQTREEHGIEDQRGGIIWHTQGSGKSLTMVYLIRKLRTIPDLCRFKVVVITDRIDLEKQLSETAVLTGEPLQRAKKVKKLEQYLKQEGSGLVFGMIQKFRGDDELETSENDEKIEDSLNDSPDILVLVDEAHRSHTNTFHMNLLSALPNCVRIGFTGTPIIKKAKQATTRIFGEFIDKYTIRQSQDDNMTVPILYEGLEARGAVSNGDDLDHLFNLIFQDKTPEERAIIRQKYATKTEVGEAKALINAKAENMLRHYITHILPNGFKAQIVASSRLAVVRYVEAFKTAINNLIRQIEAKENILNALDEQALATLDDETQFLGLARKYLPNLRHLEVAAVISGSKTDPDEWKQWTEKSQQDAHIERYKKPLDKDGLALLVVKSMLLTGFDAPLEQVLYLDRNMKEHELLQAIARVNRTAHNKDYGLVVDYYGVDIPQALSIYDTEDIKDAWVDLREELPKLRDRHQRVLDLFQKQGLSLNQVEECVNFLRDERQRVIFIDALKDFYDSLDIILPRPQARPYIADAKQLGLIRKSVADLYRDEKLDLVGAKEKVRALIDDYIIYQGIDPKVPPIDILALDFKTHVQRHRSPQTQAAEMEHAARHHITTHIEEDPIYYQTLQERLESILQTYADNWAAQVEALRGFVQTVKQGREDNDKGIPSALLPFLSRLEADSEKNQEELQNATVEIVRYIQNTIAQVNFWQKTVAQKDLRNWIVQYLDDHDLIPFEKQEKTADQMVNLARRNHNKLTQSP
ncbi:MAG: type I restriction endonuclease subunit R [Microcystaceae cyanobacterium]